MLACGGYLGSFDGAEHFSAQSRSLRCYAPMVFAFSFAEIATTGGVS
jgi:hypothetical protein